MDRVNDIFKRMIRPVLGLLFLSLIFSRCEERLELDPLFETEADYFNEVIDFERAGMGIYAKVADFYYYRAGYILHQIWLLPGDDLTTLSNNPFEIFSTLQPGIEPLNFRPGGYYSSAYVLINRANTLLEKIREDENAETPVFSDLEHRDILKGEALFLRGWMNFQLWNYFGTSPVITERITSGEEIYPPGSNGIELLDQAISDFSEAAMLLPGSWDDADRGRATRSSAYGYLGKALVFKACATQDTNHYTEAISAFNNISDKILVENYGNNFSIFDENNGESLFEYQAAQYTTDDVWISNDQNQAIGSYSAYYGYFDNHWSRWSAPPFVATQKLLDSLDPLDPRVPYIVDTATGMIQKYVLTNAYTDNGVGTYNNPRLLRYADVLLLKAEALNETGDQNGSIDLINQVRARARNMGSTGIPVDHPGGANRDQVREWIMNERYIELAAEEGHRWLDLRRWHMAGWIDLQDWDFSSLKASFKIELPKNLLMPIPLIEMDLNPNVQQNEGY
jgi:tetratricopeptide (TPR) repeat protein